MRRILFTLTLLFGMLAIPATTAAASANCSTAAVFYDGNLTGERQITIARSVMLSFGSLDNRVSSIRTGACWVKVYSGPNGTGSVLAIAPNVTVTNLGSFNNAASSYIIL